MKTKILVLVIFSAYITINCRNKIEKINYNDAVKLMLEHSFNIDPLIPMPPPPPPGYTMNFDTLVTEKHIYPLILNDKFSDFSMDSSKDSLFTWADHLSEHFKYTKIDSLLKIDSINLQKIICLPVDSYNFMNPQEFVNFQRKNKAYGIVWVSNPYYHENINNKYYIFYLRYSCGTLCYKERAYFLEYKNEKFKILKFASLFKNVTL